MFKIINDSPINNRVMTWEKRRLAAKSSIDSFDFKIALNESQASYREVFNNILSDDHLTPEQRKFFEECLEIVNE